MANLAPSKVTIQTDQTRDFSNVHNFVKKFVWDPIQSTYCYCSESRGASFAPKNVRERTKKRKICSEYSLLNMNVVTDVSLYDIAMLSLDAVQASIQNICQLCLLSGLTHPL